MKKYGLLMLALLMVVAMDAGCVGFIRDSYRDYLSTPAPSSTVMPTATSTPINQTIERQYMFMEKLTMGIEHYNEGIRALNSSKKEADSSRWSNATRDIVLAKANMEEARVDFQAMMPYAATPDEVALSDKWNDTAFYQIQAFDYVNLSYQEGAYQFSRSFAEQNPIKYNYYVGQANYYISLALQSKAEAEALESRTFIGHQGYAT